MQTLEKLKKGVCRARKGLNTNAKVYVGRRAKQGGRGNVINKECRKKRPTGVGGGGVRLPLEKKKKKGKKSWGNSQTRRGNRDSSVGRGGPMHGRKESPEEEKLGGCGQGWSHPGL